MTTEQAIYLAMLEQPPAEWGGTGAVLPPFDARDYRMERDRDIKAVLDAGAPLTGSQREYVRDLALYNQGQVPSCVAWSTSLAEAIAEQRERSQWFSFDGHRVYLDNGGDGAHGVNPRTVLQYAQDRGLPLAGDTRRYKIGSYAFAPTDPAGFVEMVKAGVIAFRLPLVALLLPPDFGAYSGTGMTSAYHQMVAVEYDPTYLVFANTWGDRIGDRGFFRVPWVQMTQQNMQNGYCLAHTFIDAVDTDLAPTPTPTPGPLSIAGYRAVVPASLANVNKDFIVDGTGLDRVTRATIWDMPATIKSKAPTALVLSFPARIAGPLVLTAGAQSVTGPWVDVIG